MHTSEPIAPREIRLQRAPTPARSSWQRVRQGVTVCLFLVATGVGLDVGLHGASVSPVAPAAPVVASAPAATSSTQAQTQDSAQDPGSPRTGADDGSRRGDDSGVRSRGAGR
jgi:hypothetical protein